MYAVCGTPADRRLRERHMDTPRHLAFLRSGGIHACTLVLPNPHGGVIHAVTGQGQTADAAQVKAIEIANR